MTLLTPDDMKSTYKMYEHKYMGDDFLLGVDVGGPLYLYHQQIWNDIQQMRWILVAKKGPENTPLVVLKRDQLPRPRTWLFPGTGDFATLKQAADHACDQLIQAHELWKQQHELLSKIYEEVRTMPDRDPDD